MLNYSARRRKNILVILPYVKSISDNKKIWKIIKPFFFNKGLNANNIMLVETNKVVRVEEIIANIMNNYFTNITTYLKLISKRI